ncbi:energy-coupled thiamine transporter ThiT [Metabacillus malikii]|uniref:Thiamine transporter n=1 Tax=Metabacillus malikii TaxID=1504265 RepID=A0ABT9ZIL1_9BACI|nr:energy-coupled thiamine transporter ThiT [Metabacillus malikii]MDQ0232108.1 thiamine transporter [Metabacillus malikii]
MNQRLLFLIEVAMMAALAFLLDLISGMFFKMPQGGTVSLGMLPVFIMAFRRGLSGGLLTGLLFGFLQAVLSNASIYHPVQGFLDYYLAFTVVGFSGLFFSFIQKAVENNKRNQAVIYIVLATLIGNALRYIVHVIGGAVFFAEYAPEGVPAILYSLGYNATYMIPTFLVSAAICCFTLLTASRLITRK